MTTTPDCRALLSEFLLMWDGDERYADNHHARASLLDDVRAAVEAAPEAVGQGVTVPLASRSNDWRDGYTAGWNEALTQHSTPVPVGERPWERDGWCDDEGRCWWWRSDGVDEFWEFVCLRYPVEHIAKLPEHISYGPCLPHWALPLPGDQ